MIDSGNTVCFNPTFVFRSKSDIFPPSVGLYRCRCAIENVMSHTRYSPDTLYLRTRTQWRGRACASRRPSVNCLESLNTKQKEAIIFRRVFILQCPLFDANYSSVMLIQSRLTFCEQLSYCFLGQCQRLGMGCAIWAWAGGV